MVGEPSSLLLKGPREKSGVCQAQSLCFLGMLDRFSLGVEGFFLVQQRPQQWYFTVTSGAATKDFSRFPDRFGVLFIQPLRIHVWFIYLH